MVRVNARRTLGVAAIGGLLAASQVGFAGGAAAAAEIKITASSTTPAPGGPNVQLTVEASEPFVLSFEGTGAESFGWSRPEECVDPPSGGWPVCTPGADKKVVIPVGPAEDAKQGDKVTVTAKDADSDVKSSVTLTFAAPVVAADWVVENPGVITYYNPGGELAEPFAVTYFQRMQVIDGATLTVTGVKGVKFTKAPANCTLNAAGTLATCEIAAYKGGDGPHKLDFSGAIFGGEQIVESKVTGKLVENEPADNTDRAVYTNNVDPAPPTPTASPSVVKPTPTATKKPAKPATTKPPVKQPELADTGGNDDSTMVIAGGAAALLLAGGGTVLIARRRRNAQD